MGKGVRNQIGSEDEAGITNSSVSPASLMMGHDLCHLPECQGCGKMANRKRSLDKDNRELASHRNFANLRAFMILGMVDPLEGVFHDPCLLKKQTELFIIAEGIHTRKHQKAHSVSVMLCPWAPCLMLPGGETKVGRQAGTTSRNYPIVISHDPKDQEGPSKLPSGPKKIIFSTNRAVADVVATECRTGQPNLKYCDEVPPPPSSGLKAVEVDVSTSSLLPHPEAVTGAPQVQNEK
ncbi:hypothetical protein U0070_000566 [Myodes glareolus]|uniref:Uncharacterized protein n=1 Tax=Myodes glareolus TaxID=447135 RepID=A0AAW0IHZ6_MYOGA